MEDWTSYPSPPRRTLDPPKYLLKTPRRTISLGSIRSLDNHIRISQCEQPTAAFPSRTRKGVALPSFSNPRFPKRFPIPEQSWASSPRNFEEISCDFRGLGN